MWENMEQSFSVRYHLLTGKMSGYFIWCCAALYAERVRENPTHDPRVGFVNFTVLGIARPGNRDLQRVLKYGRDSNVSPSIRL